MIEPLGKLKQEADYQAHRCKIRWKILNDLIFDRNNIEVLIQRELALVQSIRREEHRLAVLIQNHPDNQKGS